MQPTGSASILPASLAPTRAGISAGPRFFQAQYRIGPCGSMEREGVSGKFKNRSVAFPESSPSTRHATAVSCPASAAHISVSSS